MYTRIVFKGEASGIGWSSTIVTLNKQDNVVGTYSSRE
jgi:hypothetical protein